MKQLTKSLAVIVILMTLFSFKNSNKPDFIGTYECSADDPAQIKLVLAEDHTFTYQDFSNPKKKIKVKGNWELHGSTVTLNESSSSYRFHKKWKFLNNGQVAKSRKGLNFYTLGKMEESK